MKKKINKKQKNTPESKRKFLSFFLLFLFFLFPKIVFGQEENLDEKVKAVREAVEKRVQETISKTSSESKIGIWGNLVKTKDNTLIIECKDQEYLLSVASDADILNSARKNTDLQSLETEKPIIALGYLEANGKILAKRIVQLNKLNENNKQAVFGEVTDISREEKVLTVKNPKTEITYLIDANKVGKITKKQNEEITSIKYEEIEEGEKLIAVGIPAENGQKMLKASAIRILSPSPTK